MEPILFYNCTQPNCNRKYKTKQKFIKHLSVDHKLANIDTSQCIATEIVKQSKNNSKILPTQVSPDIPPVNNSPEILLSEIPQESEQSICTICYTKECNTVIVPCGHLTCCYDCINEYHNSNQDKGCPICRTNIVCLTKIYK